MAESTITLRLFGALHALRRERGLPTVLKVDVPESGITGIELAESLELPVEQIEGLFCNHTVRPLRWMLRPGDHVAFVPLGTPGPHRFFLGLYGAGRGSDVNSTNGTS